ncbi:MAG: hypothetical protein QOD84_1493 [Acidobacteriaceae bacterium]|jgi:prepilin-type N-terminal cleavage/methylation domain-containing protein
MKSAQKQTDFLRDSRKERGFTLVEVMVSMVILTVGLLSLLGVFGLTMAATQTSQQDSIAKQLAQDAIESIYTARDTANLQWAQIENAGATGGIFVAGLQPINQAGPDAVIGTADDSGAPPQIFTLPGPDGIVGTSDDITLPLTNFKRSIAIADVLAGGSPVSNLRTITVTVQYTTPKLAVPKQFILSGYISQYR